TPTGNSSFGGWGGACSGTNNVCNVTMSAARNVTATFTRLQSGNFTLNVNVIGNGSVSSGQTPGIDCGSDCSETYNANTPVTLTATPSGGAIFAAWGGVCSGSGTTCTVT